MSEAQAVSYPAEKPGRIFLRILWVGPLRARWLPLALTAVSGTLLFLLSEGLGLDAAARALTIAGALLLTRLIASQRRLRGTNLTRPGIELPARLTPHPLLNPALLHLGLVFLLFALALVRVMPAARSTPAPMQLLNFIAIASLYLSLVTTGRIARWLAPPVTMNEESLAIDHWRGQDEIAFQSVQRLTWKAGRIDEEPDRLEIVSGKVRVNLRGQYDRNDDYIRHLLRKVIEPRVESARADLKRAGQLQLGPLTIYPDRFERTADTPPLKLPFALVRSAHIDHRGRLSVEIEGRHEPLPLLGPEEHPFTPVALRLVGELWTIPAPSQANEPESEFGDAGLEESERVN